MLQLDLSSLEDTDLNDNWCYIWGFTLFSSSSAYKSLTDHSHVNRIYKSLWKTSCQGKHKIFFWLALRDRLSTRNMIRRRGINLDDYQCVFCQDPPEETVMHLLFFCPFSKSCWGLVNFQFADHPTIPQIFQVWKSKFRVDFSLDLFILWCWAIWMVRNDVIFKNKAPSVHSCKSHFTEEVSLLLHRTKASVTPLLQSWISSNL
jgi:hypothetical protein